MITLKQAQGAISKDDEAALTAAEARIDAALKKWNGSCASVDLDGLALREPMMEKLCDRYRAGGWSIVIKHGDQRDPGPYAELRAA